LSEIWTPRICKQGCWPPDARGLKVHTHRAVLTERNDQATFDRLYAILQDLMR
jgi:hypothetical protein